MKSEPAGKSRTRRRFGEHPSSMSREPSVTRRERAASSSQADVEIYGWRFRDQPVSVHMPIGILERMQHDITEGLNASVPGDLAGVLFGRNVTEDGLAIIIEDYKVTGYNVESGAPPFEAEDRTAGRIAEWNKRSDARRLIGFFRSQRHGRPVIDGQDLQGAERLFQRAQNIFLLVRSAVEGEFVGMFFFRPEGAAKVEQDYGEFPFNADFLRGRLEAPGPKLNEPAIKARQPVLIRQSPSAPVLLWPAPALLLAESSERSSDTIAELPLAVSSQRETTALPVGTEAPSAEPGESDDPNRPVSVWNRFARIVAKERTRLLVIGSLAKSFAPLETFHSTIVQEAEAIEPLSLSIPVNEQDASVANETAGDNFEESESEDAALYELPAGFTENPPSPPIRFWRSWLSIAATWTIAVGATMWCMDGRNLFNHRRPEVSETRSIIAFNPLGLQVDRTGGLLEIGWDRNSNAATNSEGAFMILRDGDVLKQVLLDAAEIRTGHLYYEPATADVGIRLEVTEEDGGTASESIRIVGAPASSSRAR